MTRIVVPSDRSVLGVTTVETPDDESGARAVDPPASGAGDVPREQPADFDRALTILKVAADPAGTKCRLLEIEGALAKLAAREATLARATAEFDAHVEATRKELDAEVERQEKRLAETAPQELSELRASVGELVSKLLTIIGRNFPEKLPPEESGLSPIQRVKSFLGLEDLGPVEGVRLVIERTPSWAYQDERHGWGGGEELRGDLTRAPYVEPQYSDPPIGLPSLPRNIELPPIKGVVVRSTVAARRAQRRAAEKQRRGAAA